MTGEIITTAASIIVTAATAIIATIQNKKKNKAQKKVEYTKIIQKLPEFIKESEDIFGSGTGTAKMVYVLNKVEIECLKSGIKYLQVQFEEEIEKILTTPQKKEA